MKTYLWLLCRVDVRNVNESLDSGFPGELGQPPGSVDVDVVELEVPGLELATDQVEDDVGVSHRFSDRLFVSQVKRREQDLAEVAHHPQPEGVVVVAAVGNDDLKEMSIRILTFLEFSFCLFRTCTWVKIVNFRVVGKKISAVLNKSEVSSKIILKKLNF